MKLNCITDKETDQNEIESQYLWSTKLCAVSNTVHRINLSTSNADFFYTHPVNFIWVRHFTILPNNQIFGLLFEVERAKKSYFISDENFNIKVIETTETNYPYVSFDYISCFYDDSIFIFDKIFSSWMGFRNAYRSKRYIISQDKWVNLQALSQDAWTSCIGFNQKIVITIDENPEILIYDIILDSYSRHIPNRSIKDSEKMTMIKNEGRLYLINHHGGYEIYATDDPLSEWILLCNFKEELRRWGHDAKVWYKGAYYFLNQKEELLKVVWST